MERIAFLFNAAVSERDALVAVRDEVHAEIRQGGKAFTARQRELTSWQQSDIVPNALGLFFGCGAIILCRRLGYLSKAPSAEERLACLMGSMKLSFSFAKKAEPKRVVAALSTKPKEDEGREIITSLEGGEVQVDGAAEAAKAFTIPCKNPLETTKLRLRNTKPAEAAEAAPKESEASAAIEDGKGGLVIPNMQKLSDDDAEAMRELLKEAVHGEGESVREVAPILMRENSKKAREGGAEDVTRDSYERVPVEAFGLALLRGMGPLVAAEHPFAFRLPSEKKPPPGKRKGPDAAAAEKRPRPDTAESQGEVWPCRGLVVRITSRAAEHKDFVGVDGVVLEVDPERQRCKVKARSAAAKKSQVLTDIRIADLEPRVSGQCQEVQIIRGPQKGEVAKLIKRDVNSGEVEVTPSPKDVVSSGDRWVEPDDANAERVPVHGVTATASSRFPDFGALTPVARASLAAALVILAPAIPCYMLPYQVAFHIRETEYLIEMMREVASGGKGGSAILEELEGELRQGLSEVESANHLAREEEVLEELGCTVYNPNSDNKELYGDKADGRWLLTFSENLDRIESKKRGFVLQIQQGVIREKSDMQKAEEKMGTKWRIPRMGMFAFATTHIRGGGSTAEECLALAVERARKQWAEGINDEVEMVSAWYEPMEGDRELRVDDEGDLQGRARCTFPSGNVYEGQYVDGEMHGYGTFKYADGSVFVGEFHNGWREGKGTFTHVSGGVEVCFFEEDYPGRGVQLSADRTKAWLRMENEEVSDVLVVREVSVAEARKVAKELGLPPLP
ncbi:Phosphatidylinositol 4-phosphate 5-kinase 9 [Symbiodinium microadriaticum]|uniref:Phosphatidylinositol 4-phosphate 5-kinase 9 n=1 Tax=Symbiodinium microadriaticum TaxID=2951 RepID=A0A1Q9EUA3_SYMMI|nr:Phosphatidylinositol 4-phosphate 5-kinase 9 [Symbiodinium microadriaticum]